MMERSQAYLFIPHSYLKEVAIINWSPSEDAVIFDSGETFILRQPLAQFLDGFGSIRELIHFGFMLHLLNMFLHNKDENSQACVTLRKLLKKPGVSYRNFGILAALLVPDLGSTASPKLTGEVYERLINPWCRIFVLAQASATIDLSDFYTLPILGSKEFEELVYRELRGWTEEDIRHVLRSGTKPLQNLEYLPLVESKAWEENLLGRERLKGIAPFLSPLMSSLSVPPRNLRSSGLPLGGYSDVTNRGGMEALLPTQFALDPDDFIRRFAEQELLYFRREDPVTLPESDLLIILDQGIRTWGNVRLRLAAAAITLIMQAQSRKRTVYLSSTGSYGQPQEVRNLSPLELAEILECSDLSANPGTTIANVASLQNDRSWDVVLLTHPRNLSEKDVVHASRNFPTNARLFSLSVNEESEAAWGEMKHGQQTKVKQFRIHRCEYKPRWSDDEKKRAQVGEPKIQWSGSINDYASPFKVPLRSKVLDVDFDTEDEWMFLLDHSGRVTAYSLKVEHPPRLLPRLLLGDSTPSPLNIVGVRNGFVLLGNTVTDELLLAYYHLPSQEVHSTICKDWGKYKGSQTQNWRCYYLESEHALLIIDYRDIRRGVRDIRHGVRFDLNNNTCHVITDPSIIQNYVKNEPWRRPIVGPWNHFEHFSLTGAISVDGKSSMPVSDGKPAHRFDNISEVQRGKTTLAFQSSTKLVNTLYIYQLPHFHQTAEWQDVSFFKLSPSGRYIVRHTRHKSLYVLDLHDNNRAYFAVSYGNRVNFHLIYAGEGFLQLIYGGSSSFLIDWRGDALNCVYSSKKPITQEASEKQVFASKSYPATLSNQAVKRWSLTHEHRVIVDEVGQIWIFGHDGNLVCVFLIDNNIIAGWMPDGTVFGKSRLTGFPDTPDAHLHFAKALKSSARRLK